MKTWIQHYVESQQSALVGIPTERIEHVIRLVKRALDDDRQIFVFGNGGSGANASHFATDLGKSASDALGRRFRVLSLNDNVPWLSAIANDYKYEDVFRRQLENYARPGDLALALSVSGNSSNIVNALEWCAANEVTTIAFVGANKGRAAAVANEVIVVASTHYGRVEDAHMNICHMICYTFIEKQLM